MKSGKIHMAALIAPSAVAVAALAAAGVMYHRISAFDAKHGCDVWAGLSSNDLVHAAAPLAKRESPKAIGEAAAERSRSIPSAKPETPEAPVPLAVERVEYDGDRCVSVYLNARPDMDVVRNYITVGPLLEGRPGFRYTTNYNCRKDDYEPVIRITGEYAYRTNVTLKIAKGYPLYGKGANPAPEGSMTNDFTYVFRRRDPKPCVAFADKGRYLPPGGRDAVRIESISVTNIATEIARVEPRNVVQLLAREERQYRSWGMHADADSDDTLDLSGACETGMIRCVNRPCEKETHAFPVRMNDGGSSRGVFLVSVLNADREEECCRWDDEYNPRLYRLVCLSDLGLSVREGGEGGLGVWVTSLTTGTPVRGAVVSIYSSANILLAEGMSDANGWCVPKKLAKGEPFAVVVRTRSDMTFLALAESMKIDETDRDGARPAYLDAAETDAFVWTERGIYRHGERIFTHAIVRNGKLRAPEPLPLVLALKSPKGDVRATKTVMTDGDGTLAFDGFLVPAEQPSGVWTIEVRLPGEKGEAIASREVKVEEFAPPQIRVSVAAAESQHPSNFTFRISAEHLFGGPARSLACEGAVVFEDVPFAPEGWKDYAFGNDQLGLKPCFRRLSGRVLDDAGTCAYDAPLWADSGRPKAAVRATGQGIVFEDGGRPATARKSIVCHYYPYYIGSDLPSWLRCEETGFNKIAFVCVDRAGKLLAGERKLVGKLKRIDSVYSYRKDDDGKSTWDCERIESTLFEGIPIAVGADGRAVYELPTRECGDYVLTVEDRATGVSFGRTFYLSDWGDDVVRAPLSNPTEVAIRADRAVYHVGERPCLVVKSPFPGYAMVSVMREGRVYDEIVNLTNATSEVVLRPVERDWAPNVDVTVSVVQSVCANAGHLASRAHGKAVIRVRPTESELDVRLDADVVIADGSAAGGRGSRVTVRVEAPCAAAAVVTLVDEGINLLTGERTPDPTDWLTRPRTASLPLYDVFNRILPVADDALRASGVKTGGGFGAEMLGRVSPVPTRRFKPLSMWKRKVALADGKGEAVFELPEFVGEVRVTAVAYSPIATGAASIRRKVTPKLVLQPDAPRFVAPRDAFEATMTLRNHSGADGEAAYAFSGTGARGTVFLRSGESTNLVFAGCRGIASDGKPTGTMSLVFAAHGFGESHEETIELPVRPAVAWKTRTDVVRLEPGETLRRTATGASPRFAVVVGASPLAEYVSALEWLADYPHGCLEQTASRVFPLIAAGGVLNAIASKAATNRAEYVTAGVRRVESMVREDDFVMWPDCAYAPWNREVSLYAAHFLVEAEKAGHKPDASIRARVLKFLKKWASDADGGVAAYACQTLALAGAADKDRMLRLYDEREKLNALARARLARAFVAAHDAKRAEALMKYALEPQSIKETAFIVLALLDLDPDDVRIPKLIDYLTAHRDKARLSWGTTEENAHALLAIGAYYAHHPVREGAVAVGAGDGVSSRTLGKRESLVLDSNALVLTNSGPATAFVTVYEKGLGDPAEVTDEENGIFVTRRYLHADGSCADLTDLVRGEMLIAELTITSDVTRVVHDLVIEDLFPGAFEPVLRELAPDSLPTSVAHDQVADWVLRKDARDDRMLVFSTEFKLRKDDEAKVYYPVRVVSAGDFVLPGPVVEGMYNPDLRARRVPGRLVVRH